MFKFRFNEYSAEVGANWLRASNCFEPNNRKEISRKIYENNFKCIKDTFTVLCKNPNWRWWSGPIDREVPQQKIDNPDAKIPNYPYLGKSALEQLQIEMNEFHCHQWNAADESKAKICVDANKWWKEEGHR